MFSNLSLLTKVSIFLLSLGCISLMGAGYSAYQMQSINTDYKALIDGSSKASVSFVRASRDLSDIATSLYWLISAANEDEASKADAFREKSLTDFDAKLTDVASRVPSRTADVEALKQSIHQVITGPCAEVIDKHDKDPAAARTVLTEKCVPALADGTKGAVVINTAIMAAADQTAATNDQVASSAIVSSLAVISGGVVLVILLSVFLLRSGITRPIATLIDAMHAMQDNDFAVKILGIGRKDEVGRIANSLEAFRNSLAAADMARRERAAAAEAEEREIRRRADLANKFVVHMEDMANGFGSSACEVATAARSLSEAAEETSRQAQAVAGAAEEASANVQTVAAGTEELSASIREIAAQAANSSTVAIAATKEAAASASNIQTLSKAAQEVGDVVGLISAIAEQTNLLALNATIEAARAGEAGKGFAVVASEVKALADQTKRATAEIGEKINEIQRATSTAVESIEQIGRTISAVQSSSQSIAGAVEEQGAATEEIASNIEKAALGTAAVTHSISGVGTAAETTGAASTELMQLSTDLRDRSQRLQVEVKDFVNSCGAKDKTKAA